jgi:hypothetical protein
MYQYTTTKKQHFGNIEKVSKYQSVACAGIEYGNGWVSEVSLIHRGAHQISINTCFPTHL